MKKKNEKTKKKIVIFFSILAIIFYKKAWSESNEEENIVLSETIPTKESAFFIEQLVKVGKEDVFLYQDMSSKSEVLDEINRGELLELKEVLNGWYYVQTNQGDYGYVSKSETTLIEKERKEGAKTLEEAVIVINPGHGGDDTGAISNSEAIFEKDITLSTAKILAEKFEEKGSTVILTRETDVSETLSEICEVSEDNDADIFISLHYDSSAYMNEATGTTTYYYYEKYRELADFINDSLALSLPLKNRGVEYGNFQVLRENTQAGILLELGYMNSDYDLSIFNTSSYQMLVAEAVVEGVENYFQSVE